MVKEPKPTPPVAEGDGKNEPVQDSFDDQLTGKVGRPSKVIDYDTLNKLIGLQCTVNEIASFFEISTDTVVRRIKERYGVNFAEYYKTHSVPGKISLRRKLWNLALINGNTAAVIFLAKNYLGMSDYQPDAEDGDGAGGVGVREVVFVSRKKQPASKKPQKVGGDNGKDGDAQRHQDA